ncbi:hypothetical protein EVAR_31666_1 [Eumeta japonica]|uniref:Uncharacterized protein n=1 Tax=Eumeta variegata TaxID=151549 RepID=A0A4C1VT74_EUMVA|nr:hypothetical protein EVAR_31666_1 [Eumeta japonica]
MYRLSLVNQVPPVPPERRARVARCAAPVASLYVLIKYVRSAKNKGLICVWSFESIGVTSRRARAAAAVSGPLRAL